MASVNKVIIVGNLGRDPETRYLPSGDAVSNINVATTDRYKDKATGEMKEATEWHRISFFGKLAEIAGQYLKKVRRSTSKAACAPANTPTRTASKNLPLKSVATPCRCSVADKAWAARPMTAVVVAVTLRASRPRQPVQRQRLHSVRRLRPSQRPAALMTWTTTFRFDLFRRMTSTTHLRVRFFSVARVRLPGDLSLYAKAAALTGRSQRYWGGHAPLGALVFGFVANAAPESATGGHAMRLPAWRVRWPGVALGSIRCSWHLRLSDCHHVQLDLRFDVAEDGA